MNKEEIKSKIKNDSIVLSLDGSEKECEKVIYSLGVAFSDWMKDKLVSDEKDICVAVGYDETDASLKAKDTLFSALDFTNATVYDCKKTFVGAMYLTVISENANGGIFVSFLQGSNSIKLEFISRIGYLSEEQLCQVDDFFENTNTLHTFSREPRVSNSLKIFAENIRQSFCRAINSTDFSRPLRGLKFVVDSSGSVGDYFVNLVLLPLGAEVVEIRDENLIQKQCNNVCADIGFKFSDDFSGLKVYSKKYGELTKEAFTYLLLSCLHEEKNEAVILLNYPVTPKMRNLIKDENIKFEYCDGTVFNLIEKQNEMNDSGINCPAVFSDNGVCAFHSNHGMTDPGYLVYKIILKIIALRDEDKNIDGLLDEIYNDFDGWKMMIESFDKEGYAKTVMSAFEGYSLKNPKWITECEDNIIRNKTDKFVFEIENADNEYLKIKIQAVNIKVKYLVLREIYLYFSMFTSLNFEELEGIFDGDIY